MGGGQATNSGINYQQRIAAFLLTSIYTDFDIATHIGIQDQEFQINTVSFETDTAIDDLVLESKEYQKAFLQIKRTVSLSIKTDSDFYKTINQFMEEYISNPNDKSIYGLVTSSKSSKKVKNDLKKILLSIRLNHFSFHLNPLNHSEQDTLDQFQKVVSDLFTAKTNKEISNQDFISFCKKCFVVILDVETGESVELAAQMLLKSKKLNNPELVWALLIKNSLQYGSQRLSINNNVLISLLDKYKVPESFNLQQLFEEKVSTKGNYSVDKDILIIKSFVDDVKFLIVELYRFDEFCNNKLKYENDKLIVTETEKWEVIQRFATWQGLERYVKNNVEKFDGEIPIIPTIDREKTIKIEECEKLHQQHIRDLLKQHTDLMSCLHCGKVMSSDECLIVEIDDSYLPHTVGMVHDKCVRTIDRIIGVVEYENPEVNKFLLNFNFKLWVKLILKGQGLVNSIKKSNSHDYKIFWNHNFQYDKSHSYCIKIILEDGSFAYDFCRGKIERLNISEAKYRLDFFKKSMVKAKKENNPMCFTSVTKMTGTYSMLLQLNGIDEEILEVTDVKIIRYSKLIAKLFENDIDYYYAPLCYLQNATDELIFNLNNVIPLISNPIDIERYIENWEKLNLDKCSYEKLELCIIKSDKDFDNFIRMINTDEFVPIIDPLFDIVNKKLIQGYPIHSYEDLKD